MTTVVLTKTTNSSTNDGYNEGNGHAHCRNANWDADDSNNVNEDYKEDQIDHQNGKEGHSNSHSKDNFTTTTMKKKKSAKRTRVKIIAHDKGTTTKSMLTRQNNVASDDVHENSAVNHWKNTAKRVARVTIRCWR